MRSVKILAFLALGWAAACSASSDNNSPYGSSGSGGSGGTAGSGGVFDSGPGPQDASSGDALPVSPEAATDVFVPDGDTCLTASAAAEPFPLDMYVMMDQSGSMGMPVNLMQPLGPTQWTAVRDAFVGFLNDTTHTGMSMGIQYFPLPIEPWDPLKCGSSSDCSGGAFCAQLDNGKHCVKPCTSDANCAAESECLSFEDDQGNTVKFCSNDTCDVSAYATPEVPIAELPGVNASIIGSLNAHAPLTMTPTAPALEGAIQYASQWATTHPGHTTIVVLATDGQPTVCGGGAVFPINEVRNIAAAGVNGSPSIKTFVIGVIPAGMATLAGSLDGVAQSGGTNKAFIVQANQDMTAQFKAALEAIRGASMDCEFQIPNPGVPVDYDEVNVMYTAPGGDKYPVYFVGSIADCDPQLGGWFYDVDPAVAEPTKITLCPQSCQFMQEHSGAIAIEIGCKTITPPK